MKLTEMYSSVDRLERYEYLFRGRPKDFASTIWDYIKKYPAPIEVVCEFIIGNDPSDFRSEDSPIWIPIRLDESLCRIRAQYKSDGLSWLVIDVSLEDIGDEAEKYWNNFLEYMSKKDLLEIIGTSTNGDMNNDAIEPWMKVDAHKKWWGDAVRLLHEGRSSKYMADEIGVSIGSVNNLFTKLRDIYGEDVIPYRRKVCNKNMGSS